MAKEVVIFPFINIDKIIKVGDFEIHPIFKYDLKKYLEREEINNLNEFTKSFRETLFNKGKTPKKLEGIGILKYKGTILRTNNNSNDIGDKIKILFLLLKLHITVDYFNPAMSYFETKAFEYVGFNCENDHNLKFGVHGKCDVLYSTKPDNIKGLKDIKFYSLDVGINNIPLDLIIFGGGDEILGVNPSTTDMSYLYNKIIEDTRYYAKFKNLASIYYGLETQNDLFFYFSLIPTILEIILHPIKSSKKKTAVEYGDLLDSKLILNNDFILINCCNKEEKRGLIARTISEVYNIRNKLLHQGIKDISKTNIIFKGHKLYIYDVLQLIFKFSILNEFIDKNIIENNFLKLRTKGSALTTGDIKIFQSYTRINMDEKLKSLLEKSKSDKEFKDGLYKED